MENGNQRTRFLFGSAMGVSKGAPQEARCGKRTNHSRAGVSFGYFQLNRFKVASTRLSTIYGSSPYPGIPSGRPPKQPKQLKHPPPLPPHLLRPRLPPRRRAATGAWLGTSRSWRRWSARPRPGRTHVTPDASRAPRQARATCGGGGGGARAWGAWRF